MAGELAEKQAVEKDGEIPLITVIVPAYNEEENIDPTFATLKEATDALSDYRFEFIFIDNRSTDNTYEKLEKLATRNEQVRVLRFARNFGFQKSVLTGYRLARGAAAIQIDADLQDPPSMFAVFLEKWREGHDVVVGIRRQRKESKLIQKLRRGHYWLLARLDGDHLVRDAGDFRLVDRSVIAHLRRINEPHMYLRGLISSLSRNQTGIVYDREKREFGDSKYGFFPLLSLAMDGILSHSSFPLKVSFYVGIITAAMATALAGFYLLLYLITPDQIPAGFTTTQLLILFGIGINALFLGIVGVYVGRIYDQVRVRPMTIISDLINFDETIDELETALHDGKWHDRSSIGAISGVQKDRDLSEGMHR